MRLPAYLSLLPLALGAAILPAGDGQLTTTPKPVVVPGRYIVMLKEGVDETARKNILKQLHEDKDRLDYDNVFKGFATALTQAEVDMLQKHPDVEFVEEDHQVSGSGLIEQANAPWNLARVSHKKRGATTFVYDETAGEGVCAYVIDSGIDDKHADFEGRAKQIKSFVPGQKTDVHGHGTHVAGILGSKTYGVAKKVTLYGVKVLDAENLGYKSWFIKGIEFVTTDHKKRQCPKGVVANLSTGDEKSEALNRAAAALVKSGVFFGVAAGNFDQDASIYSPGSEPSVCVTGAIDSNDKPWYTGPGQGTSWGSRIDVFAPGVMVESLKPGGGTMFMTGTSQASPHVVGIAAYLASLEGLRGTKALCDRIKKLSTKNAIINQHAKTANRIAFNGATLPRKAKELKGWADADVSAHNPNAGEHWEWSEEMQQQKCKSVDQMYFYFELSANRGSMMTIKFDLPATGSAEHVITHAPTAGFHEWQRLDMKRMFNSDQVELSKLTEFRLISDVGNYIPWESDYWKVESMKFRARCVGSGLWVENDKWASFGQTFNPWKLNGIVDFKDALAPRDWVPTPPCTHLKMLQVTMTLSDKWWAGTDNDLYFAVGKGRFQLAHHPSRKETYTIDADLQKSFGARAVPIKDVTRIAIESQGGHDKFLPQHIDIRGVCDGPKGYRLEIEREADEAWIPDGGSWSLNATPDLWRRIL